MKGDMDALTERFAQSLGALAHEFGPQVLNRLHTGLTAGQFFTMRMIRSEGRLKVSQLAERLEVTPSAITVMIDRLEHHGYVSRLRDEEDRRVVVIELTEAGRAKLAEVERAWHNMMREMVSRIEPGKVEQCVSALETMVDAARHLREEPFADAPGRQEV
ncbi:MarR family winged helix-turn-helix transcriptional regulator [Alicyclobacillus vulcanalis]|uniref:DNA-binding transcriptional regulator, MarR family n=1 Tax=Alicyclobacillus vulcanalis TaxID=252246 RepID=A0A1N7KWG9_9BACL|nr:MarR family transcriptional regulator [Alicyclobacillus vulcanalis]SIS65935.1 DNA-binding transcriptional regulator, MarR family [Alicyclobacillus vulcanalis]